MSEQFAMIDLPDVGDRDAIYRFVIGLRLEQRGFGYVVFSHDALDPKSKRKGPPETVNQILADMYFAYRCANHQGVDEILIDWYEKAKPDLERLLVGWNPDDNAKPQRRALLARPL